METLEYRPEARSDQFLSDKAVSLSPPAVASGAVSAVADIGGDPRSRPAWDEVIDRKLIEWGRLPEPTGDDFDPPSDLVIARAMLLAVKHRDLGLDAPDRVVLDPNGGVVFEFGAGPNSRTLQVWDDGEVESRRFEGGKLVESIQLLPAAGTED